MKVIRRSEKHYLDIRDSQIKNLIQVLEQKSIEEIKGWLPNLPEKIETLGQNVGGL